MSFSSWSRIVVTIAAVLLVRRPAWAGDPTDADRATARELGGAGLAALDAKDYPTALDRLSRALVLYDVPTLRLGRARALRGMGQLVSAAENYRAIVLRTPVKTDPPAFVQAARDARRELPEVEAKVAHLTIMLSGSPASLRVDGVEWPAVAIGVPRPLDPGEHVVEATDAAQQVQSQKVVLAAGQNERLDIMLSAPKPPPEPIAVGSATTPSAVASMAAPPPPDQQATSTNHTAAIVTTVISGALAAGALITGVIALSDKSDFNDQNRADVPQATKEDLRSQASTMAAVSTVLTGAALVGTGLSIYFWATPSHTEPAQAHSSASGGLVLTFRY